MSSTYYVYKTLKPIGIYTCSECQSIIVNEFCINITGISSLTQERAFVTTDDAVNHIIQALHDFPEKPFLVTETLDNRTLYTRHIVEIDGANRSCPYCGTREKWQWDYSYAPACKVDKLTGVRLVADVPVESRMRIFSNADDAIIHATTIMNKKEEEFRQHWIGNSSEQQRIQNQIKDLTNKLQDLESQQKSTNRKTDFLLEQIQKKETEMKIFSLFSAERKTAKAELKMLKEEYTIQHKNDLALANDLLDEIETTKKQIKTLLVANPGVTDDAEIIKNPNTRLQIAYRIS